jgi:hypothetical protein
MVGFPFVVSGSTLLTALSRSKGYRTMNGKRISLIGIELSDRVKYVF